MLEDPGHVKTANILKKLLSLCNKYYVDIQMKKFKIILIDRVFHFKRNPNWNDRSITECPINSSTKIGSVYCEEICPYFKSSDYITDCVTCQFPKKRIPE